MLEQVKKRQKIILIILVIAGILAHAWNMLHYPYYENDEGVYMSQAWSLLTMGKLAPYTYWYDHAPAGWIFIALWNLLTGGFFTFGFSINSGRVFMLVLQAAQIVLLFFITKKLTKSFLTACLTIVIFSFSPLGIYFHRRVLLDNIMTFWVLLSLFLLLFHKHKLRYIILSAIAFGISVLSKENSIFFIPVFLYIIYLESHYKHKSFTLVLWLALVGVVISTYFLYAIIKSEFFVSGSVLGGNEPHVSLLGTLKEQYSRTGGGIMDVNKSAFWNSMRVWIGDDPVIIYAGIIATLINLILGIKLKIARIVSLLSFSMWLFLIRGGLVIEFYIVPLIPFLALNIAVVFMYIKRLFQKNSPNRITNFLTSTLMVASGIGYVGSSLYYSGNIRGNQHLYTSDQTSPQIQAVDWILSRGIPSAFYVIDNYGYIDLQVKGKNKNFKNAEWYWKVDRDPAVMKGLLSDNPENIDFIALTPQMEHDITTAGLDLSLAAWHNSKPYARFWKDGWGVEFWATNYSMRVLTSSWESYKTNFIKSGKVIDPHENNITTSEGQSYALLRSVWMNDKETFDTVFKWTKDNLQQNNGLLSWKLDNYVIDKGTASDADQDTAVSLLFAYKLWGDYTYLIEAQKILNGIWENEVIQINNKYYMTAANWANHENAITINPSYLNPAYYKIFAEADKSHPWLELVNTSYEALNGCTSANLDKSKGVLPPEWCSLNKTTLLYEQPGEFQPRATEYSYNAFRIPLRVSLDYFWFNSAQAKEYLSTLNALNDNYTSENKLTAAYQHDGTKWENYETVAAYSGNLGYFMVEHPDTAKTIYETKILNKLYEDADKSYWEDPNNYYTQNMAWFATGLYANKLINLWN